MTTGVDGGSAYNVQSRPAAQLSPEAAEYESELEGLTINSKPIINSLTIIAGENMDAAPDIVATIERRIETAPSNQKLPALYLLDSIIKNIGGAYVNLFARNIVNTFIRTFVGVDDSTREALLRLLRTWQQQPIFPMAAVRAIEVALRLPSPTAAPVPPLPPIVPAVSSSGFLGEHGGVQPTNPSFQYLPRPDPLPPPMPLQQPTLLPANDVPIQSQPHFTPDRWHYPGRMDQIPPPQSQLQPPMQSHLLARVSTVTNREALVNELAFDEESYSRQSMYPVMQQPPPQQPPPPQPQFQAPPPNIDPYLSTPQPLYSQPAPQFAPQHQERHRPFRRHPHEYGPPKMPQNRSHGPQMYTPPPPNTPEWANSEYTDYPPQTHQPGRNGPHFPQQQPSRFPHPQQHHPPPHHRPHQNYPPPSQNVPAHTQQHSAVVEALYRGIGYGGFAAQCTTCGLRFTTAEILNQHMDWHFAWNKRDKQRAHHALSRSWFPSAFDWARSRAESPLCPDTSPADQRVVSTSTGVSTVIPSGEAVNLTVRLPQQNCKTGGTIAPLAEVEPAEPIFEVVADDRQPNCSYCNELFVTKYNHEKEEWMLQNAVIDPSTNKIVHVKCLNAAMSGNINKYISADISSALNADTNNGELHYSEPDPKRPRTAYDFMNQAILETPITNKAMDANITCPQITPTLANSH
ncbi:pre-mRNA cleavage complex 2 protein Pcf11 [Pelomyxa schiedti]|nr:pre-mRNA cleavage complex 2 protein Pcf11 [Pelomyxa schiedti]